MAARRWQEADIYGTVYAEASYSPGPVQGYFDYTMDESVVFYDGDTRDELAVEEQLASSQSSPRTPVTRTVAIIKHHALEHRFDIERQIQDAGFEIVKERQMEFDTDTDPETLEELFGEDTHCLSEGPVWVYILERRRAIEVWHALMGPRDPEHARMDHPDSLRALYGISEFQNGLMGSQELEIAEVQIAALFASSPPFPVSDLPPENGSRQYDAVHAEIMESLARTHLDEGYAPSNVTNPSTVNGSSSRLNANGKPAFKARAMPATTAKPDIVPRMTRASALRTGQPIEKTVSAPRQPVSKERQAQTFANVPGHKRSSTIAVASTAAPTIAPRMTRAAALRLGITPSPQPTRTKSATTDDAEKKKRTFDGVPGHKRRETISVASTAVPTVAPRLNKSAALRLQQKQGTPGSPRSPAPPTSFRGSSARAPSISRASSNDNLSPARARPPSVSAVRPAPRPSSATPAARPPALRRASSISGASSISTALSNGNSDPDSTMEAESISARARPRPRSVCSAPSITPKLNKAAALRVAKKEAEAAAAAAAAAKKQRGVRAPPSSFKAIAT